MLPTGSLPRLKNARARNALTSETHSKGDLMPRHPLPLGGYGEISFQKRDDNQFYARARYRGFDGVTRQVKALGSSRAKARENLKQRLEALTAGATGKSVAGLSPTSTVKALCEAWLEERSTAGILDGTVTKYRSVVNAHVIPLVGGLRLHEANTAVLEARMQDLRQRVGVDGSGRSVPNRVRQVLNGAFGYAVKVGVLNVNPVSQVSRAPKPRKRRLTTVTAEDIVAIRRLLARQESGLKVLDGKVVPKSGPRTANSWQDLLTLMLGTGMRIGEALALRWEDINLLAAKPTVTISGTVLDSPPRRQAWPKTAGSYRTLIIPDYVQSMLLARQVAEVNPSPLGLVFHTRRGTPVVPSNHRRIWNAALKGSQWEALKPHDLRATVATTIDAAVGVSKASDVLGHAQESTTVVYLQKAPVAPDVTAALAGFAPPEDLTEGTLWGTDSRDFE